MLNVGEGSICDKKIKIEIINMQRNKCILPKKETNQLIRKMRQTWTKKIAYFNYNKKLCTFIYLKTVIHRTFRNAYVNPKKKLARYF